MDEIEAARVMGMKRSEVLEVASVDDGHAVRTHDGQWTLVRDDGTLRPAEAPAVALERDSGVGESAAEEPSDKKPAPKRRGQS